MPSEEYNKKILGQAKSLWIGTTPRTNFSKLNRDIRVDVVVIGAGITGLTTALLLKENGFKVAVLESDRIVKGTTGYTTAKVTSAHGMIYRDITARFGTNGVKIYAESNQSAIEKIVEIIKANNISCDFERTSAYTYAHWEKTIPMLRQEFEASKSAGLPVSWQEDFDLPFKIWGAIRFQNQAQFHPRKYLLGVAKIIQGNGSHIFEQTRVLKVENGKPCITQTENYSIKSKYVIIATRTPFIKDSYLLNNLSLHEAYVIAARVKKLPFKGVFYSEEDGTYSLRTQNSKEGKYLIIGGPENRTTQSINGQSYFEKLEKFAKNNFGIESIDYHWGAQDNISADNVPFIGQYLEDKKNIFVACGFGAWGMTNGTLSAMIISDLIRGLKNSWAEFYDPQRVKNKSKLRRNVVAKSKRDLGSELGLNEGELIDIDGGKTAIYKDKSGGITILSPVCRHMGCIVGWNNKDKTWDCPCHGSRYDKYGKVIHGPAKKDLIKKDI